MSTILFILDRHVRDILTHLIHQLPRRRRAFSIPITPHLLRNAMSLFYSYGYTSTAAMYVLYISHIYDEVPTLSVNTQKCSARRRWETGRADGPFFCLLTSCGYITPSCSTLRSRFKPSSMTATSPSAALSCVYCLITVLPHICFAFSNVRRSSIA